MIREDDVEETTKTVQKILDFSTFSIDKNHEDSYYYLICLIVILSFWNL